MYYNLVIHVVHNQMVCYHKLLKVVIQISFKTIICLTIATNHLTIFLFLFFFFKFPSKRIERKLENFSI